MNVPSNLKYSNDHEWCRLEGDTAYVGITDFAQSQLGDIVFVDVPTEGETVAAGEVFGTIEAVKTVSDAFLPMSGEIVAFNEAVDADPSIVNKDPYGEGWLVKVRVSDLAEYDALLTPEQYAELIGNPTRRHDRKNAAPGIGAAFASWGWPKLRLCRSYRFSSSHSAICTALRAAPLRIWSLTHQKASPLGLVTSRRMRPT